MIYTRGSVQLLQRLCKNILRMGLFRVCVLLLMLTSAIKALDHENIVSAAGQSVILPCRAAGDVSFLAVEWRRHDLEGYVLSYRDNHLDPEEQAALYRDRVDLKDRSMQNGDLSLLLMNVTVNDSGTYKCEAFQRGAKRRKRQSEVLSVVKLSVSLPGGDGNHLLLLVLVPVAAVVVLVAGIIIYKKNGINSQSSPPRQYEMTSTSQQDNCEVSVPTSEM